MARPTTSAEELTIFALSKIYQRHTVIFNASKPWTTLEPDGEMLEDTPCLLGKGPICNVA